MATEEEDPALAGERRWLARLGIVDVDSGRRSAQQAREHLVDVAATVIPEGAITMGHVIFAGTMARTQSLHEGALQAIESQNPHAAFTLLRAYAEQCAAIAYLIDHPGKAERLWKDPEERAVPIGQITNHAHRSGRMKNFRAVYEILSRYAHPTSTGHFASMQVEEDGRFTWSSGPRFKREADRLIAYAWAVEFSRIACRFLFEYAESVGLGRLVPATEGE